MLLKYNISDIKRKRRLLNIKSAESVLSDDGRVVSVIFTTETPHGLSVGDHIFFTRNILSAETLSQAEDLALINDGEIINVLNGAANNKPSYYRVSGGFLEPLLSSDLNSVMNAYNPNPNDILKVINDGYSLTTFKVEFNFYHKVNVLDVIDGETISVVRIKEPFPFVLKKGDSFTIQRKIWVYEDVIVSNPDEIEYIEVKERPTEYAYSEYVKNTYLDGIFYKWTLKHEIIPCIYISDFYFETSLDNLLIANDEFEVEDTRFLTSSGEFKNSVNVYEYAEMINITLPLISNNATELNDEEVAQALFNEKREALIPDIIDYEKRCFSPCYKVSNKLEPVSDIRFNLYFRDRSESDNWTSSDVMGWNQYKLSGTTFTLDSNLTEGDLLGFLNFTDDDVYYRKQKIAKSFLRLSFYDSKDPMTQQLLFYSTVFLDGGDLYGKYVKNVLKKIENPELSLVKNKTLGVNNLTASFNISDRYNRNTSSEGFYLYMFPDGIMDGSEREIYMKAEFNHAGYGYTIPFMRPTTGTTVLSFGKIPTSLIDPDDGDLKQYYNSIYIPVRIKYDTVLKDFVYYFPIVERTGTKLKFNLYEPKLNPIE